MRLGSVNYETRGKVAILTLDEPNKLNALMSPRQNACGRLPIRPSRQRYPLAVLTQWTRGRGVIRLA